MAQQTMYLDEAIEWVKLIMAKLKHLNSRIYARQQLQIALDNVYKSGENFFKQYQTPNEIMKEALYEVATSGKTNESKLLKILHEGNITDEQEQFLKEFIKESRNVNSLDELANTSLFKKLDFNMELFKKTFDGRKGHFEKAFHSVMEVQANEEISKMSSYDIEQLAAIAANPSYLGSQSQKFIKYCSNQKLYAFFQSAIDYMVMSNIGQVVNSHNREFEMYNLIVHSRTMQDEIIYITKHSGPQLLQLAEKNKDALTKYTPLLGQALEKALAREEEARESRKNQHEPKDKDKEQDREKNKGYDIEDTHNNNDEKTKRQNNINALYKSMRALAGAYVAYKMATTVEAQEIAKKNVEKCLTTAQNIMNKYNLNKDETVIADLYQRSVGDYTDELMHSRDNSSDKAPDFSKCREFNEHGHAIAAIFKGTEAAEAYNRETKLNAQEATVDMLKDKVNNDVFNEYYANQTAFEKYCKSVEERFPAMKKEAERCDKAGMSVMGETILSTKLDKPLNDDEISAYANLQHEQNLSGKYNKDEMLKVGLGMTLATIANEYSVNDTSTEKSERIANAIENFTEMYIQANPEIYNQPQYEGMETEQITETVIQEKIQEVINTVHDIIPPEYIKENDNGQSNLSVQAVEKAKEYIENPSRRPIEIEISEQNNNVFSTPGAHDC